MAPEHTVAVRFVMPIWERAKFDAMKAEATAANMGLAFGRNVGVLTGPEPAATAFASKHELIVMRVEDEE